MTDVEEAEDRTEGEKMVEVREVEGSCNNYTMRGLAEEIRKRLSYTH